MQNKVSVITVCYDEEKNIGSTLDSILSQDYPGLSCIVKDGGSEDATLDIVRKYAEAFDERNIPFTIISGKDKGIYDGMNTAVLQAEGDWILFLNAGDRFYSKKVLSEIFIAKDWSRTDLIYGDTAEEEYGELHLFRKAPERIAERMPFSHQSCFVRKEWLLKYPFKLKYPIAADYDFLLTLHFEGAVMKDSGAVVSTVSKDGVSSVKLIDTYRESLRVKKSHGIALPSKKEFRKLIFMLRIKQWGMDHFPDSLKHLIRKIQWSIRGQRRLK
ncbi:MAG: glycosyltransferase [Lachnospiraceae bacterium]|nr:glycosyltransferase [Lachnospiraceae bacterium]